MALTDQTHKTLLLLLNFLKSGLVSRSGEVCKWTCNVLTSIAYLLDCMSELDQGYTIFIKDLHMVKVIVAAIKRHPDLKTEILEVLTSFGKEHIKELMESEVRPYLPSGHGFFKFTHELFDVLLLNKITARYMQEDNLLSSWIEESISCIGVKSDLTINTNIYSLNLVVEIWVRLAEEPNSLSVK